MISLDVRYRQKAGKMADHLKRNLGILLVIISLLICAAAAVSSMKDTIDRYCGRSVQVWSPEAVRLEPEGPVSVNTAEKEELTELYGVGETIAEMIIAERGQNGPYYYPEDLEAVRGIGPSTLLKFRSMINLSQDESGE